MEHPKVLFSELKSLRLQKQWSQEMLAEMSGLSVRTIQRIEQGHKASLESTKALNAIFEVQFVESISSSIHINEPIENDIELEKKKEAYSKDVKEFLDLCVIAGICLLSTAFIGFVNSNWHVFGWTLFGWMVVLAFKGATTFDFIGERIEDKLMKEKFNKEKKTH